MTIRNFRDELRKHIIFYLKQSKMDDLLEYLGCDFGKGNKIEIIVNAFYRLNERQSQTLCQAVMDFYATQRLTKKCPVYWCDNKISKDDELCSECLQRREDWIQHKQEELRQEFMDEVERRKTEEEKKNENNL